MSPIENNLKKFLHSKKLEKIWSKKFNVFSEKDHGIEFEDGEFLLEQILNNQSFTLNEDLFVYRDGQPQVAKVLTDPLRNRLSPIDSKLRSLIMNQMQLNSSSVKVVQAQRYSKNLLALSKNFTQLLNVSTTINLYYTPAYSKCFETHTDPYEIFVLQTSGEKTWNIGDPAQKFNLKKGELLYLPANMPHSASTGASQSCHLTIGFHPISLSRYFTYAMKESHNELHQLFSRLTVGTTGPLFKTSRLDDLGIQKAMALFKRELIAAKNMGLSEEFKTKELDCGTSQFVPFQSSGVFPDTVVSISKKNISLIREAISELKDSELLDVELLIKICRKETFYAGEIIINSSHFSWKFAIEFLQLLCRKKLARLSFCKTRSILIKDGLLRTQLKKESIYIFPTLSKSLALFCLRDHPGYIELKGSQINDFWKMAKLDSSFVEKLSKNLKATL